MRAILRPALPALALLLLLDAYALAQGQANIRYLAGGRERYEEKVNVTEETYSKVTARRGPTRISVKPEDLISIEYTRGPGDFAKGRTAFNDGDYLKAVDFLTKARESRSREKWLPVYLHWYLGRAQALAGDIDSGIATLSEIPKLSRNHRLVPEVFSTLAEYHTNRGSAKDARAALNRLKGLRLGGAWDVEVTIGEARVDLKSGDANKALQSLRAVETSSSTMPAVSQKVRLLTGQAHFALKDYVRAEAAFVGILESKASITPEARAGACNGLGDCQMALRKFEDAFKSYSRTFVWFKEYDTLRSEVAHALFNGGKALQQWSESLEGENKKTAYNRGKKLFRIAAQEFGGTAGAAAARKALGN